MVLIGSAAPVWAWGDLGHKIICQIAFQELNEKARKKVIRLIPKMTRSVTKFAQPSLECIGELAPGMPGGKGR